jgi:hypothetical protein
LKQKTPLIAIVETLAMVRLTPTEAENIASDTLDVLKLDYKEPHP